MEPLVFTPYLRPMVWGGRRLAEVLGKALPAEGNWGESWEISVHPTHISHVADGPLVGCSLKQLVQEHPQELFGANGPESFPLLIKFLDAQDMLSVQVHPNDHQARELSGEALGKTEAWVVLDAEPGGRIFAGLKPGIDRRHLQQALQEGRVVDCLHSFAPNPGDCLFLRAGTVHAVGGGILLAEVQQSSDATLRLYDWDRPGPDGKLRPLHLPQSLDALDWKAGPVSPVVGEPLPELPGQRLVRCDYFVLDRFDLKEEFFSPYRDQLSLWIIVGGTAELRTASGYRRFFRTGSTVLVPAVTRGVLWRPAPTSVLLGVTLP